MKSLFLGIRTGKQERVLNVTSPLMSLSAHLIPHGRIFGLAKPIHQHIMDMLATGHWHSSRPGSLILRQDTFKECLQNFNLHLNSLLFLNSRDKQARQEDDKPCTLRKGSTLSPLVLKRKKKKQKTEPDTACKHFSCVKYFFKILKVKTQLSPLKDICVQIDVVRCVCRPPCCGRSSVMQPMG